MFTKYWEGPVIELPYKIAVNGHVRVDPSNETFTPIDLFRLVNSDAIQH